MDLSDDPDSDLRVCLPRYLGPEFLAKILSYLWFDDHAVVALVCVALHDVIQSESLATYMLQRLLEHLNQPLRSSRISFNAEVRLVLRRISSWPTAVDAAALNHSQGPRNVTIVLSDHLLGNDSRVIYHEKRKENRSKAYAVAISDDHFPCLPSAATYRFKNEINQGWIRPVRDLITSSKVEAPSIIIRSTTPFTKVVQISENEQVVTLSCVGYFESQVRPMALTSAIENNINDDNDSHQLHQLQLSIGLACALFPLRGRRVGFDKNSFGYHGDGRIYHGGRNCIKIGPSYDIGDTVGCGVLYPPLGKQHGQIFYTKNGVLSAVMDIGVGGLLSLPWFPIVGLAPSIPIELNFGIHQSFAFDVIAFEEQQLVEAFVVDFAPPASASAGIHVTGRENENSFTACNGSNFNDINNTNNSSSSCSDLAGSPSGLSGHSDPWRYYETLAEEQEAKQRIPRHPKYRNSRWDLSNRYGDSSVGGGGGAGVGGDAMQRVPLSTRSGVQIEPLPIPLPLPPSSSSSSSFAPVRTSKMFLHTEDSGEGMSLSNDDSWTFDPDSMACSPREVPMLCVARTGRGGRERGRGCDFLLAKRQYAYISRSAKLERLSTIISATNAPHAPNNQSASSSSAYSTRKNLSSVFGTSNTQNEAVGESKRVCVSRERTLQDKGKRKRKSLFLNPDLRAATLSEISSTSKPAMGGSDASCEDEDEEDSEEEEDDEEELASTCGQDAESHDEWGFRGFRANRPLLPPRVMIRAPTSYSAEGRNDDDDDLGSMAVEPSSEDEDEDEKLDLDPPFTAVPRPSSSPLAMKPPSLPEGSRRKPKTMYHTYNSFESSSSSYQQGTFNQIPQKTGGDTPEDSMGVFVALADVAHGSGPDWLRRGSVIRSTAAYGSKNDRDGDSDESVATSLFVEVASVDECGSYIGYGGAGESEEEDEIASERGSRNGTLSHSLSGHPVGWGVGTADADGDLESLSVEDKGGKGRKRKFPSGGSRDFGTFHSSSSNNMRVMWDPDGDGYDGASERGRCETDGFEDFNTDGDVEFEEVEEREDRYSNSSGSGYDGSVDADGCASDTYATERNSVARYTLHPSSTAVPRGGSPSMHSQDSSVSSRRGERLSISSVPAPYPLSGQGRGHPHAPQRQHSAQHTNTHTHSHVMGPGVGSGTGAGGKRPKRRKMHQPLGRRDSDSKENTDDQQMQR